LDQRKPVVVEEGDEEEEDDPGTVTHGWFLSVRLVLLLRTALGLSLYLRLLSEADKQRVESGLLTLCIRPF